MPTDRIGRKLNRRSARWGKPAGFMSAVWMLAWSTLSAQTPPAQQPVGGAEVKAQQPVETGVKAVDPAVQPPGTPPAQPAPAPTGPAPKMVVEENTHDFGEVWIGEPIEFYFTIKNDGEGTLNILNVQPSCGCTAIPNFDKVIEPGKTGKVGAKIDTSKLGTGMPLNKQITVTSDDPVNKTAVLTLKTLVKAYVNVEPKMLNFGKLQASDQPVNGTVTITNNTPEPLTLEAEPPTGSDKFKATVDEVEKGKVYKVTVSGTPPFAEGTLQGAFKYKTNVEKQATIDFTVFAQMPPRLELQPAMVMLGMAQPVAQTRVISLINNGKNPLKVLSADVDDPDVKATFEERPAPAAPPPSPGVPNPAAPAPAWLITLSFAENYSPPVTGRLLTIKTDDSEKPELPVQIKGMPVVKHPLEGKEIPVADIQTLAGQTLKTKEASDNKVTMLDFYATWCPHCSKMLPTVQKVYDTYKDKGVRVIGVSLDDKDRKTQQPYTAETLAEYVKQNKITYPTAHDPKREVGNKFTVTGFPTIFMINKAGVAEAVYSREMSVEALSKDLDRMLAGEPVKAAAVAPTAPVTSGADGSTSATRAPGH